LHVVSSTGDVGLKVESKYSSNGSAIFEFASSGTANGFFKNLNRSFVIASEDATYGDIRFRTGGTTERMRINVLGNVGIGTTTPTKKLDVNGSANINGDLKVLGNIISDGDICIGVCE
jgi:hypothetical protein